MKKLISVVLLVAMAGVGSWFFFTPKPAAPLVTFETLQNESLPMASLRGKVVLVKFWATSCVTCVQQMPDTIALYNDLHAEGLEGADVAMD